jgi:hypothetical protein
MTTDNREMENQSTSEGRRELLKAIAAGTGALAVRVLLPAAWTTPVITALALPAHAAMSGPSTAVQESVTPAGTVSAATDAVSGLSANASTPLQNGEAVFTVKPPSEFYDALPFGNPIHLVEQNNGRAYRIATFYPQQRDAVFIHRMKSDGGTRSYQLRWATGYTSSVTTTFTK